MVRKGIAWRSSVCWDLLATGVTVLFQNTPVTVTIETSEKHYTSKSGGEPANLILTTTEDRVWREGKIVFT